MMVKSIAQKIGEINPIDMMPAAIEKLVHELFSDSLLMLSRYITLDTCCAPLECPTRA